MSQDPVVTCVAMSHNRLCDMATNLDVDLDALDELVQLGNFRSKREAVDAAVREAIAFRKQLRSLDVLGTIEFLPPSATTGDA